MKADLRLLFRGIALAILLTASHSASAFYNPTVGRWISRDPIVERGGANLCGFVDNNPANLVDDLGQAPMSGGIGGPQFIPPGGFPKPPPRNSPPDFIGGETHFFIGSGFTRVSCCDENKTKRVFWYRKICIGGAIGFGAGGGAIVSGLSGTNCRGKNYEGWFYELGGSIGPVSGGVDVGYTDAGGFSGVNEIGGGVGKGPPGVMFKSTWCYYTLFSEKQIPCGCGK